MSHREYTLEEIARFCGGKLIAKNQNKVSALCTDSRKVQVAATSLFIALRGQQRDGHKYIRQAYDKGLRTFLVQKESSVDTLEDCSYILVPDTTKALQQIVAQHRSHFDYPVVAITGSNGKTIVKEWLNQLLASEIRIVRSPKSYNSQIGVPLSVWTMGDEHKLGLFEAGISQVGEMEKLEKIIQPTIGILTNVRQAHRENFSSQLELAQEKVKLFGHSEKVICSAHYPEAIQEIRKISPQTDVVIWGDTEDAKYTVDIPNSAEKGTVLKLNWKDNQSEFFVPFSDKASIENALHCIVCLLEMGYDAEWIASRTSKLLPIEMRLEILRGKRGNALISDVYSADPESLIIALDHLANRMGHEDKVLIISQMHQSAISLEEQAEQLYAIKKQYGLKKILVVGAEISQHLDDSNILTFHSTEELLASDELNDIKSSSVLVKGARVYAFERVINALQEKTHDTIMEIDLDAMAHNLNTYRQILKPNVQLMVMVKAQGYGTGSDEVAQFLEFNQVDYLGVAYTDEGIALRNQGIGLPIMVMNPERGSLEALIEAHLEPEIYSFETLERFALALKTKQVDHAYPIHLKIDTGMHRLGFRSNEMDELAKRIKAMPQVEVISAFTHLAASDEDLRDDFTRQQLDLFQELSDSLKDNLGQDFLCHALNTAGISRFPEYQMDLVRLGIGLYGVSADTRLSLRNVGTLKTIISQIKEIAPGESVGYSQAFVADKPIKIATIPVGYADGLFRSLGNGKASVEVFGKMAPIVGNICMDMCMIDVTEIPCVAGDEVIVFGKNPSIQRLAQMANTIPYEILSSVSERVKRIYLKEDS
jgi:Alr-MurF fusion protein